MRPSEQEKFINQMYIDIFQNTNVDKIPEYFAEDYVKDNNYDISDYEAFVAHIKDLKEQSTKANFDLEYIVNIPTKVVVRTIVSNADQIAGSPPLALLISYWQFNDDGLINYCKEVEYQES